MGELLKAIADAAADGNKLLLVFLLLAVLLVQIVFALAMQRLKAALRIDERRRQQAKDVSQLLGLWLGGQYNLKTEGGRRQYRRQKKYWELAMVLDKPVLDALNKAFGHDPAHPGAPEDVKEALKAVVHIRKALVGSRDGIKEHDLAWWEPTYKPNATPRRTDGEFSVR